MKKLFKLCFVLVLATAMILAGCSNGSHDSGDSGTKKDSKAMAEIIPAGSTVTVNMTDNSAWSGYVAEDVSDWYRGVYIKDRSVTLSPFAMGKYEVTQELFETVMGINPSELSSDPASGETQKLRPVENVNWYDAIAFCNKLSILEGLEPCYTVSGITDWAKLAYSDIPSGESNDAAWDAATCDLKKKGYRLPTEAEWEYAARGGKDSTTWRYSYAGVNTANALNLEDRSIDTALEGYAWYKNNSGNKTHEVGLKKPNVLGLYDMSGNVWEWCWDWFDNTVSTGTVTDPTGPAGIHECRCVRSGCYTFDAYDCTVSYRSPEDPYRRESITGFRLARSL